MHNQHFPAAGHVLQPNHHPANVSICSAQKARHEGPGHVPHLPLCFLDLCLTFERPSVWFKKWSG